MTLHPAFTREGEELWPSRRWDLGQRPVSPKSSREISGASMHGWDFIKLLETRISIDDWEGLTISKRQV
ncbi:hypothetical protein N7535_005349 [Penicillium sp. DV-2018c]|nr:hypothetical protein N7461_008930 [Penicillium sp. DV-2018c]KAJ5571689.1 hypothetical protein N7535_005349 [Penicillium sp. DV-2018c]